MYRKIEEKDFPQWMELASLFWPKHTQEKLQKEFQRILGSTTEESFLYQDNGSAVAFINVAIRNDYVEGSNTSPVGYLEGIYVKDEYRNKGIAQQLFKEAEQWLREKGVTEIGSDAMTSNTASKKLHEKLGFTEGETLIHFLKKL